MSRQDLPETETDTADRSAPAQEPPVPGLVLFLEDSGSVKQRAWTLSPGHTIGRAGDIMVGEDTKTSKTSRVHAVVERLGGAFVIKNRSKKNKTFVNGRPVGHEGQPLEHGAIIRCGWNLLSFKKDVRPWPGHSTAPEGLDPLLASPLVGGPALDPIRRFVSNWRGRMKTSVLISGETGTGKELVARAFQMEGPFVTFSCGALPPTLAESELFGHVRGAFTGADSDKTGAFRYAENGVLFLDEIGDLPLDTQPKLLRAIDNYEVQPVGLHQGCPVMLQVVAATNRFGQLRDDVYGRFKQRHIELPPLRERREDVPALIAHYTAEFLEGQAQLNSSMAFHIDSLESVETVERACLHSWTHNVRDLRNLVEEHVVSGKVKLEGGRIRLVEFAPSFVASSPTQPDADATPKGIESLSPVELLEFGRSLRGLTGPEYEGDKRRAAEEAMRRAGWKMKRAAPLLGISVVSLRAWLNLRK